MVGYYKLGTSRTLLIIFVGEYALAYILAPGAYARRPLIWRVQDLVKISKFGIPSVWMYGDVDWMDIAGGYAAEEKFRSEPISDT